MVDVDVITQEVIGARLNGIVSEMQVAIFRTGFSTIIRETHDFSCALLDWQGRLVGSHSSVVGHNGAYPYCVAGVLEFYDYEDMKEGDSFVINSAYHSGVPHPMDIVVVTPIFYEGSLVAFCASIGHKSDIGGLAPGSRVTLARDVYGEGLQILPVRFQRDYQIIKETEQFFRGNSRSPHLVLGDLTAQAGALWSIGGERLIALMDQFGKEVVESTFDLLGKRTEQRLRRELEEWPDGVFEGETFIRDVVDSSRTIRLHVAAIKEGDRLIMDFSATGDQSEGPVNIRPPFLRGISTSSLTAMVDPSIPNNWGSQGVIDYRFRSGSLVDPIYPGPTGFYSKNLRAIEGIVNRAMTKASGRPAVSFGGTQSSMVLGSRGASARPYVQYEIFNPGSYAFEGGDGWPGTGHGFSGSSRFTSIEILEAEFDVRLLQFAVTPDTGGAGKFRGGSSYRRDYLLKGSAKFTGGADRRVAQGTEGGMDGVVGAVVINPGTPQEQRHETMVSSVELAPGDVVRIEAPAGGGVGDPKERERERVIHDVEDGIVSSQNAIDLYGMSQRELQEAGLGA
ncbi:MAG: N-methylhydantoinase B [Chloroflexi bacterium]|jgi:N-methylhydantoinase B|nr:MAG: N-methylhydantoinase B [Chloroflexota bacterium]